MPCQPPPEREPRRRLREPLIAWRNRADPVGLETYDSETGNPAIMTKAIGLSIGKHWFFGLTKYRIVAPAQINQELNVTVAGDVT